MFNRKLSEKIEAVSERRREGDDDLMRRYWALRRDFDLLLDHLGVHIDDVPSVRVLRKKGGPEKG